MNKMRQISKEFDEPFTDVVRGFAEMGYSRRATAQILNVSVSTFRKMCDRFNLHRHFPAKRDMRKECKGRAAGWPKGKKKHRKQQYTDREVLAEVAKYPASNLFSAMADISLSTVKRRFGSWTTARSLAHGD